MLSPLHYQTLQQQKERLMEPEDSFDRLDYCLEHLDGTLSTTSANLAGIEQDLAEIKASIATRVDLLEAKNSIIKWIFVALLLAQQLSPLLAPGAQFAR